MTEWGLFRLNPKLFRIETEALELLAPFGGQMAETLDADAAGQAAFDGRFDKVRRKECERDGHVDLTEAAFLAGAKLCDGGRPT